MSVNYYELTKYWLEKEIILLSDEEVRQLMNQHVHLGRYRSEHWTGDKNVD